MVEVDVEGREVSFFVDTGAEVTVITEGVARVLNKEVKRTGKKLLEAGGGALEVLGEVEISMRRGKASTRAKAAVVRGASKPLLGRPEIAALGLIQSVRAIMMEEVSGSGTQSENEEGEEERREGGRDESEGY